MTCSENQSVPVHTGAEEETRQRFQLIHRNECYHQRSSRFLRLPGELRNIIYSFLFWSTRLSYGERLIDGKPTRIKPAPNSLAILHTCRKIYEEAKAVWLDKVFFSFESPKDLLDKFSILPDSKIRQIRYARVFKHRLELRHPDSDRNIQFRLTALLKLLPALQLDTLVVFSEFDPRSDYNAVHHLVQSGNGWRRLCFISPTSKLLGYAESEPIFGYRRFPQPLDWRYYQMKRDGENLDDYVMICRAVVPNRPNLVHDFRGRLSYMQDFEKDEPFGEEEDEFLCSEREIGKEVIVIVQRSKYVNITEESEVTLDPSDYLRQLTWSRGLKTWPDIRRELLEKPFNIAESPNNGVVGTEHVNTKYDAYNYVDEYAWPSKSSSV